MPAKALRARGRARVVGPGTALGVVPPRPAGGGRNGARRLRLPTDRRGMLDLGPLILGRVDALGLASGREAVDATKLTVYPKIVRIVALPHSAGEDPLAGSTTPTAIGQAGDDSSRSGLTRSATTCGGSTGLPSPAPASSSFARTSCPGRAASPSSSTCVTVCTRPPHSRTLSPRRRASSPRPPRNIPWSGS